MSTTKTKRKNFRKANYEVIYEKLKRINWEWILTSNGVCVQLLYNHNLTCLDCTGVYIGETGRSFKTRRKGHQRDVKPDMIAQLTNEELKKKSALVKHVCLNGHRIDWKSSKILANESTGNYKKRRFLESFYTHKTDFSFNDKINSFYPELYKFINF